MNGKDESTLVSHVLPYLGKLDCEDLTLLLLYIESVRFVLHPSIFRNPHIQKATTHLYRFSYGCVHGQPVSIVIIMSSRISHAAIWSCSSLYNLFRVGIEPTNSGQSSPSWCSWHGPSNYRQVMSAHFYVHTYMKSPISQRVK